MNWFPITKRLRADEIPIADVLKLTWVHELRRHNRPTVSKACVIYGTRWGIRGGDTGEWTRGRRVHAVRKDKTVSRWVHPPWDMEFRR